jgi:hypothetical protein
MKNSTKTVLATSVALSLLLSANVFAATGDDSGNNSGDNTSGIKLPELAEPVLPTKAKAARGEKRIDEAAVNAQLNLVQQYLNGTSEEIERLYGLNDNASSWALTINGLKEYLKTYAFIEQITKDLIAAAEEKDPKASEELKELIAQIKLDVMKLDTRILRHDGLQAMTSAGTYKVDISDKDDGILYEKLDGKSVICTTEGYKAKTPINENYLLCTTNNPGTINNGSDQLLDFFHGNYLPGETEVIVTHDPYQYTDLKWELAHYNIEADNPKTKRYYNALMFGGDHVITKLYSNIPTVTDPDAVPVLKWKPEVPAKPKFDVPYEAPETKPQEVIVVNPVDNPVNTKEVK